MDQLLPALGAIIATRGVFLRREALAAGYDEDTICARTRSGAWVRVRHGAYTTRARWSGSDVRAQYLLRATARQAAAQAPSVLSHATSAALHGCPLWNLDLQTIDVTGSGARAGRREAGVRHHRGRLEPLDVVTTSDLRHTNAARMVLEILTSTDLVTALCVGNDALRRGVTTLAAIEEMAARTRNWPGTLGSVVLLRLLDPRCESVAETRLLYLCFANGLTGAVPQFEVRDGARLLGRVDVAFPEFGVFVEFDGRSKYTDYLRTGETVEQVHWREKRRQEAICAYTGWECVRLTWAELENPEQAILRIQAALNRARARRSLALPSA